MKARRPTKFYASPISSLFDKFVFSVAFFGGIAAIFGIKYLGFHQIWASLVSVGVMIVYVALVWASKRLRVREDHIGDNVYYLGFLFTLTSLGYALWALGGDGGINEASIQSVIANFGIALLSTIFGVWLRVLVNQFRTDPAEVERESRVELTEASNRVRAELSAVLVDLGDFRRQILQIMRESIEETSQATKAALVGNTGQIVETTEALLNRVDTASSEYAVNTARINQLSSQTAEALERLTIRIREIEAPSDLITSRVLPVVENINSIASQLQQQTASETRYASAIATAVNEIGSKIPDLANKLEHAVQVSDNLRGLNKQIATLQERLSNISESQMRQAGILNESANSFTDAIKNHTDNLLAQHGLFEETVSKFAKVLQHQTNSVELSRVPNLKETSSNIEQPSGTTALTVAPDTLKPNG